MTGLPGLRGAFDNQILEAAQTLAACGLQFTVCQQIQSGYKGAGQGIPNLPNIFCGGPENNILTVRIRTTEDSDHWKPGGYKPVNDTVLLAGLFHADTKTKHISANPWIPRFSMQRTPLWTYGGCWCSTSVRACTRVRACEPAFQGVLISRD